MRCTNILLLASTASAFSFPDVSAVTSLFARKDGGNGKCPSVWTQVSAELTSKFLTGGQCNPDARAAIRAIFHDCGGMDLDILLYAHANFTKLGKHL